MTILTSNIEYSGKANLSFSKYKTGAKLNDIIKDFNCGIETLFGKLDLSCVDFSKIGLKLECKEDKIGITLCQLFNYLASQIEGVVNNIQSLDEAINNFNNHIDQLKDEKVKIDENDTESGYLEDKIKSRQPGTISKENNCLFLIGFVPIGGYIAYDGAIQSEKFDASGKGKINTDVWGFALANGNNGTLNLNEILVGSTTQNSKIGNIEGSNSVSIKKENLPNSNYAVSFSGTTSTNGNHSHVYYRPTARWGHATNGDNRNFNSTVPPSSQNTDTNGSHNHTFSGSVNLNLNPNNQEPIALTPRHIKMAWLKRIF